MQQRYTKLNFHCIRTCQIYNYFFSQECQRVIGWPSNQSNSKMENLNGSLPTIFDSKILEIVCCCADFPMDILKILINEVILQICKNQKKEIYEKSIPQ